MYGGLREALSAGWRQPARLAALHPQQLARHDLLLCSFETLRAELVHAQPTEGQRASRAGHRLSLAQQVRSPLLALSWWRVVLDEAQMVECSTAKAAAMARQVEATHRWAVSGTPLGHGRLTDVYGLMSFLRLEPWADKAWWGSAPSNHAHSTTRTPCAQHLHTMACVCACRASTMPTGGSTPSTGRSPPPSRPPPPARARPRPPARLRGLVVLRDRLEPPQALLPP